MKIVSLGAGAFGLVLAVGLIGYAQMERASAGAGPLGFAAIRHAVLFERIGLLAGLVGVIALVIGIVLVVRARRSA